MDVLAPAGTGDATFVIGGGETGELVRTIDWRETALGAAGAWPQSLRTALDICLSSRFPIALYWGPRFSMLYNDGLLPMVGANKHPWALGRPAEEVLPEIWPIIFPLLRSVVDTGEAIWSEDLMLPLLRSEAPEESYFTFTYSPVRDEAGSIGGVLCAVIETTDKVIEERRLRLLNALAETTTARTPNDACELAAARMAESPRDVPFALLYLLDEPSRVARLVGHANIESGTELSPPSIAIDEPHVWPLREALNLGEAPVVPLSAGPAGARGAVVLRIERSGGGRPFGFIVAGLSSLLRSGDSYARFHRLLAASIAQGVSNAVAYEQERLRAETLAELDRAKTAFFTNISHEFRTPLTLMLGPLTDLVQDQRLPSAVLPALEVIQRNGRRLQKLVNTLLEVSKLEAQSVAGDFEPFDIASGTRDAASMFQAAVEKAGLKFVLDLQESLVVQADGEMWEKIVVNLVSNAFKHTFDGEIELRLRRQGDSAKLTVRDTGVGIPLAELGRVFGRFHRVAGARSRTHEGTGIGLALVRELVRLHQGEVEVTSVVDEGTTFTVTLPLALDVAVPTKQQGRGRVVAETFLDEVRDSPGSSFAGTHLEQAPRVLVVDDNADMRGYVKSLLAERWRVDTAETGSDALRAMRAGTPDVVVSDVMMPGMDGLELLAAIRGDAELAHVPVIFLSARAGQEASVAALAAGASDYVVKPFSSRELVARVEAQVALAQARSAERRASQRLQALLAEAPVAMSVVKGPAFVFELANPRYEEMVGRTGLIGKPFRTCFPELEADAPVLAMLAEVRASGNAFTANEYPVTLKRNGSGPLEEVFFMFTCQPIREPDGTLDGILTIAVDVTESVKLRRSIEGLAHREREARAAAEAASALKDEFLSTASHELRTPLNAILGWARLLAPGKLDGTTFERGLKTIERNALVQVRLIEDILDGSRIISGKLRLEVRSLDLTQLIHAAIDAIRPAANAKSIVIAIDIDPTAVRVMGDPDRLQQVVWNLTNNAIKFTPKGGRVDVSLRRIDTSIELCVEDNGQGIDPGFLPHIFERFRQADSATTRRHGGLGLGLALVRHLVEAHGGSVRVHSEGVGRGARFSVTLPVQAILTAAPASDRPTPPAPAALPAPVDLTGVRALVIDDEPDARDLVAIVLRNAGALVTTANHVQAALALVVANAFDILISDIGMPDSDGYELIKRLRSERGAPGAGLPAVALTAYAREQDAKRALAAGFQSHVTKPAEPSELLRVVASLVGRSEERSE